MSRKSVFVTENKKNIEKMRKKYNNMQMSEVAAAKVYRLDVASNALKAATAVVGVVTVIDLFIPDPVLGIDEVGLTAITGLLGYVSSLVDNKAKSIANDEDASIQMDEVTKLTEQIGNAAKAVKGKGNSSSK